MRTIIYDGNGIWKIHEVRMTTDFPPQVGGRIEDITDPQVGDKCFVRVKEQWMIGDSPSSYRLPPALPEGLKWSKVKLPLDENAYCIVEAE